MWIDLSASAEARLYFRHARVDRFFLRTLALARGIDEVAREEIAHVVANTVAALGKGSSETLTRGEARIALQLQPAPDPGAGLALCWSAALEMGGQVFAHEIPLVAAASGLLGVSHRLPGWKSSALGGWASFGYQLAADYQDAMALRAGLLFGTELHPRFRLELALGAGAERIHYSSQARRQEVTVAPGGSFYVPAITGWVALELGLVGGLGLTLRLHADALLQGAHFDLEDRAGQASQVLRLYWFRPGAGLGLVYRQ